MFHTTQEKILNEISAILRGVQEEQVSLLIEAIVQADKIVSCGAGRMGMMARAFAMRLGHLDLNSYHLTDCNTPRIGEKDLLLVCSGSGETITILSLVEIAKKHQAKVALITTRVQSRMAALSDIQVLLPAPPSIQPMTSLTEQSCLLFFDTLVMLLMKRLNQSPDMLKNKHSILE